MSDIVFIEGLTIETIIGVYDWERSIKQTVCLDIELLTDISVAARTDNLVDALDYKSIADRVTSFAEESQYFLLEALADQIASLILSEFSITWLRLRISKPRAIQHAQNVGLVIERGIRP